MSQLLWSVCVFVLALVVLALELFIPSAGMLGVLGATFVIASIVLAFLSSFSAGMTMLVVACVVIPMFLLGALKVWPNTPIGRRILLDSNDDNTFDPDDSSRELQELEGQSGIAISKMLPSGVIRLNGLKYDAISEGPPIDAGDPVTIIAIRMNKIVVRKSDVARSLPDDIDDPLAQPIDDVFEED